MIKLANILKEAVQPTTFIKELERVIKKLLPNVVVEKNNILASTALDARNKPIVRIDSKAKPTALWLTIDDSGKGIRVIFKTIVNNKEANLPGHGKKLFAAVADVVKANQKRNPNDTITIVIDHDVSGGFWKHIESEYPELSIEYQNND